MLKFLRNMRLLLLLGVLALPLSMPTQAIAQTSVPTKVSTYPTGVPFQLGYSFSFIAGATQTTSFNTAGLAWYQMIWVPTGTVSGCTLTVDGSAAGSGGTFSTGSLVASQTCTTSGTFTSAAAVFSTAAKVTPTITGSGSVTVFLFGYVNNPATAGGGAVTVSNFPATQTVAFTTPAAVLAGQQAVTGTAAALAANALTKGLCIEALSTNVISVYVGPSGVTTSTGIELSAGSAYCPVVSNSNAIFVVASTTGASVTWSGN